MTPCSHPSTTAVQSAEAASSGIAVAASDANSPLLALFSALFSALPLLFSFLFLSVRRVHRVARTPPKKQQHSKHTTELMRHTFHMTASPLDAPFAVAPVHDVCSLDDPPSLMSANETAEQRIRQRVKR